MWLPTPLPPFGHFRPNSLCHHELHDVYPMSTSCLLDTFRDVCIHAWEGEVPPEPGRSAVQSATPNDPASSSHQPLVRDYAAAGPGPLGLPASDFLSSCFLAPQGTPQGGAFLLCLSMPNISRNVKDGRTNHQATKKARMARRGSWVWRQGFEPSSRQAPCGDAKVTKTGRSAPGLPRRSRRRSRELSGLAPAGIIRGLKRTENE